MSISPTIGLDHHESLAPATPSRAAPWRGAIVVGVAALITPVGYFGNEGMAPLVALGGLLTLPLMLRARLPSLGVWILGALAVWAAASFAWSPLEADQLAHLKGYNAIQALTAPKLLLQFILYAACLDAALRLSPLWRRRALWVLACSVAITIAVLLIEGLEGALIYERLSELFGKAWSPDLAKRNAARGCYGAVVLFWPAAALFWRRDLAVVAVSAFVAAAVGAMLLGVDAPVFALIVALGAFLVVRLAGRFGVAVCAVATTIYFVAAPLLFLAKAAASGPLLPAHVGKLSWRIRLDIWRFASQRVVEHPWTGWGLDSSRAWPDQIPMHPHDAALQLWLETGVVGVLLAVVFWLWLFWRMSLVAREDRDMAAVMAAVAASYLTIGAISFGVWQEWWLALGVFAIGVCAMLGVSRQEESKTRPVGELVPLGQV